VVLNKSDIQTVGSVVFDISPYLISTPNELSSRGDPPERSSTHFSCNLPFLGTANNNLSFKLSTNKLIVLSAPKLDLEARLVLSSENFAGKIGVCTVEVGCDDSPLGADIFVIDYCI